MPTYLLITMAWRSMVRAVAAQNKQTNKQRENRNVPFVIQLNILLVNMLQFGWYLCMDKPPLQDTEYKLFDYQLSRIPGDKVKDNDIISTVLFINSSRTFTSFNSINLSYVHYLHQGYHPNCVNNKVLECDWFLRVHIHSLILLF